jgi:hypothetical protein
VPSLTRWVLAHKRTGPITRFLVIQDLTAVVDAYRP